MIKDPVFPSDYNSCTWEFKKLNHDFKYFLSLRKESVNLFVISYVLNYKGIVYRLRTVWYLTESYLS